MMSREANAVCPRVDAYIGAMGAEDPPEEGRQEPPASGTDEGHEDALHDNVLHEEIELVGQLVVAATSTPHRLSQQEIDKVLGGDEVEHGG
jgi:hypothetical protein